MEDPLDVFFKENKIENTEEISKEEKIDETDID